SPAATGMLRPCCGTSRPRWPSLPMFRKTAGCVPCSATRPANGKAPSKTPTGCWNTIRRGSISTASSSFGRCSTGPSGERTRPTFTEAPAMPRLTKLTPMFRVRDVRQTIDFYTQVLGFTLAGLWPDEQPTWCCFHRDDVEIMFYADDEHGPADPKLTG